MGCSALRSAHLQQSQSRVDDIVCMQVFYPTGAEARIATAIGRVECLCRLGRGGRCADLDVAARDAIKERLLLRAVATCCAGRVEHRTAHYNVRWSWRVY